MRKRFFEWIALKLRLDSLCSQIPKVSEGDIWWASLGENVGWEISGKSKDFTRPVIVFKKFAEGFYFVIPTTTQRKNGSWYVPYRQRSLDAFACLQQA